MQRVGEYLELLDWRRRVAELYARLRQMPPDAETLDWFRREKDDLFRSHPQSPIPAEGRAGFEGLKYWPYDLDGRVLAQFESAPEAGAPESGPGTDPPFFSRIGWLSFEYRGEALRLGAHWIHGYAGGLFVPFRDETSGAETYGGGRYLLDTIKSADLGSDAASGTVLLDFNYAYHPSCAYDPRWVCPLTPPENRLRVPVRAGERV